MAQEARLCGACRKHTLQTLYKGTRLYRLSTGCSLCELIRPEVVSHLGLSEGDELPEVKLRVVDEERPSHDLSSVPSILHEVSRFSKERLWCRFPRAYGFVKLREHSFGRLQVLTPGHDPERYHALEWLEETIEITQLKVTPLEGRSLTRIYSPLLPEYVPHPFPPIRYRAWSTPEPPINP